LSPLFRVDYLPQTPHSMFGGQCMCRRQHAFFVSFARSDRTGRAPDRRLTAGMCRRRHALFVLSPVVTAPPSRRRYRMTITPSALRVYPPQTLLEERMRLAAHVCAASARCDRGGTSTHCCDKVRETYPAVPGGGRTPGRAWRPMCAA
jgi:hypothetical protein